MSQIARQNPEATEEQIAELAMRLVKNVFRENYFVECRSCGQKMSVAKGVYDNYESKKASGVGFTAPKCADCWL